MRIVNIVIQKNLRTDSEQIWIYWIGVLGESLLGGQELCLQLSKKILRFEKRNAHGVSFVLSGFQSHYIIESS